MTWGDVFCAVAVVFVIVVWGGVVVALLLILGYLCWLLSICCF